MIFKNLSKTFKYVNDNGDSITFEYAYGFLINKPVGIDTVQVSLSQAQGINQVGVTVQSKNVQPRPVNITGILVGNYQDDSKSLLLSTIRPDIGGRLYADDFYLEVWPVQTPVIEPKPKFAQFSFALLAPYPYWQHDEHAQTELSKLEYRFKLPFKFGAKRTDNQRIGCVLTTDDDYDVDDYTYVNPYMFAEENDAQFFPVVNRGQLPVPFTLTLFANNTVVNPSITNAVTNEYLKLNTEMETRERIVVEITHDKTYVTSSVNGDIRGAIDLSSKLFQIAVGSNVLKPDAESGKEYLQVSIDFATEMVGVTL